MSIEELSLEYKNVKTIFIIGGGPSLEMIDLSKLNQEKHIIFVSNKAYQLYPNALLAHHSDIKWFNTHKDDLLANFKGRHISGCGLGSNIQNYPPQVEHLHYNNKGYFLNKQTTSGLNTAQQLLIIAHFFEPQYIVLLGVDQGTHNGKCHWRGAGSWENEDQTRLDKILQSSNKWFNKFQKQQLMSIKNSSFLNQCPKIINVSPISKVTAFEKYEEIPDYVL